jgi:2-methylisocitrate lyase-like PEP mutase family enzyme
MLNTAIATHRYEEFQRLHTAGCFTIPNPWDVGSARILEGLGFRALATTSSGCAWSQGLPDGQAPLEAVLNYFRGIVNNVALPVSADFEGCFAAAPDEVHRNVLLALQTGIAGLSIEDSTVGASSPVYEFNLAVDRVKAARSAIADFGKRVVLTARFEGFLVGVPDINEATRRLSAYADAGADCLYAPGIRRDEDISAVVAAVAPKAVNVLVGADFTSVEKLATLGVRRISVGGALARSAWTGFLRAAREIAESGTFTQLSGIAQTSEMNDLMGRAAQ